MPDYESRFHVISNKLISGRPLIHIHSSDAPGEEFEAVNPELEDVFSPSRCSSSEQPLQTRSRSAAHWKIQIAMRLT